MYIRHIYVGMYRHIRHTYSTDQLCRGSVASGPTHITSAPSSICLFSSSGFACRAVSGGPVYVSDKPGCHDVQLLRQLVLPDGSIYRAAGVGRPTLDCLFVDVLRDGVSLLKVGSWSLVNHQSMHRVVQYRYQRFFCHELSSLWGCWSVSEDSTRGF